MRLKVFISIFFFFWLCIGCILLVILYFFWTSDYHGVCIVLCDYLGKSHRIAEFKQSYLTLARFQILRYSSIAGIIVYILLFYVFTLKLATWLEKILLSLQLISLSIKAKWNLFSKPEKWIALLLLLLFLSNKLYQIITVPIFYDEAWTFLNFSSKPIFVTISYYPAPNNHILFTLLTDIFSHLPLPVHVALRLPNLFILAVAAMTTLLILRDWFSASTSLIGMCFLMVSYPVQLYSLQARGYLLYILLSIIVFYLTWKIIEKSDIRLYQLPFIFTCIVGFYVMPSFLYVVFSSAVSMCVFLIKKQEWQKWKYMFFSACWIGTGTVILYLPVFIVSGVKSVYDNPYVKRYPFSEVINRLMPHFIETANWQFMSDYGYIFALILLLGLLIYTIKYPSESLPLMCLIFLICPIFILLLHNAIPFQRTWSYCIFPLVVSMLIFINQTFVSINQRVALLIKSVLTGIVLLYGIWTFIRTYPSDYNFDYYARDIAERSLQKKYQSFYIDNDYFEVLMYYYYSINRQSYQVDTRQIGQQWDVKKEYDCLILSFTDAPFDSSRYEEIYYKSPLKRVLFKRTDN